MQIGIVRPAVNAQQAIAAWNEYMNLKASVATKDDIQQIQGKDFLKKSYWRKIATFFNLNVDIIEERHEQIGKTVVWHFTCKATAPNGRYAIGTGSCDAFEKAELRDGQYMAKGDVTKWAKTKTGKSYPVEWDYVPAQPNSIHNIRTTAETRAFNRAVSNLVGGGEVSADEIVDHGDGYDLGKRTPDRVTKPAQTSKPTPIQAKPVEDKPEPTPAEEAPASEVDKRRIFALGKQAGFESEQTKEKVKEYYELESFNDLTDSQAKKSIKSLELLIEKKEKESTATDQNE